MNDVLARLEALEAKVAGQKDWKQKCEEGQRQWQKEKKVLEEALAKARKLGEVLREFLGVGAIASPGQATKEMINLEHKELVVNVAHEEKEINLTTETVIGKVLYCALTELDKEGFSQAELSDALKDHGWNIQQPTLAPTLGRLVKEGNLVRVEGSKPMKYRLPGKVKLNVRREAG